MDATAVAIGHFITDLALALEPENVNVLQCVVSALTWTGHTHEGLRYAKEAIRIHPRFGMAHYACGNACADLGLTAEAVAHYEKFHRLEPSSFLAYGTYYRLARAYPREGNSIAAESALAESLSLNAASAPARCEYAVLAHQQGRSVEAVANLNEVQRLDPAATLLDWERRLSRWLKNSPLLVEFLAHLRALWAETQAAR